MLRKRAEEILGTSGLNDLSSEDVLKLVHKFQLHQIELETQNDDLRRAQIELTHARDRYSDLYDFAPVGLLSLDREGNILQANHSAATLLGVERKELLNGNIAVFFTDEGQDAWHLHQREMFADNVTQTCELPLRQAVGPPLTIRLEGRVFTDHADRPQECHTAIIDVTSEQEAKRRLQSSEQRYRRLTDAMTDYVFTVRVANGHVTETIHGPRCADITGYSPQEFAANDLLWISIVPPEDRESVKRHVQQILDGQAPPPLEHRLRRKDGSVRWVLRITSPHLDNDHRLISYDGLLRDITAQKEADIALRELNIHLDQSLVERTSELQNSIEQIKLFGKAIANLGEGVVITNDHLEWPDPIIVFVNEAICRITGYTTDELIGQSARILQDPEKNRSALARLRSELSAGRSCSAELVSCRKDGSLYDAEIFITPLFKTTGRRTNFVAVYRDITERKSAQQTLKESEERLRAILNTAADAIVNIDTCGTITDANPATEQMFGYSQDELIGKNVSMLMGPPHCDQHSDYISRYLETGEPRIIGIGREVVGKRKNGSTFPVDLAVSQVDHLGLFSGIIRDITDRKQAEEAFRREHEFSARLTNTSPTIVLVLDTEGRILRFNPYFEQLTGWQLDEVQGRSWFETFLPQGNIESIRKLFQRAIHGEQTLGNVNAILTKDGRELEGRMVRRAVDR